MGLVQNPGRCTDHSGYGSECDCPIVFAPGASLEGKGVEEVSKAVRHRHGAWNTPRGAAGQGLSRPTAQSLNMHLK